MNTRLNQSILLLHTLFFRVNVNKKDHIIAFPKNTCIEVKRVALYYLCETLFVGHIAWTLKLHCDLNCKIP